MYTAIWFDGGRWHAAVLDGGVVRPLGSSRTWQRAEARAAAYELKLARRAARRTTRAAAYIVASANAATNAAASATF
jgi:hypothetical protein